MHPTIEIAAPESRPKQVLFSGTTPNIGTTIVAFGTAQLLSHYTDQQIAYVCLNLKSSKIHHYLGWDKPVISMDQLRGELKTRQLTSERLVKTGIPIRDNLTVFVGNQLREQAEYYAPEDITYYLHLLSSYYDYLIVDVHAYWDNAATVQAMLTIENKVLVTSAHLAHFQEDLNSWYRSGEELFHLKTNQPGLFITQLDPRESGYSTKDIRAETGLSIYGSMKRSTRLHAYLNEGRIQDMVQEIDGVRESIDELITAVFKSTKTESKSEPWLKRLKFVINGSSIISEKGG